MTHEAKPILEDIISDFAPEKFIQFFRAKSRQFKELKDSLAHYNDDDFAEGQKMGEIKFTGGDALVVCAFAAQKPLSERSGKKAQYDKAKKILKDQQIYTAGIFIFSDKDGNFRFSLVYPEFTADKKIWSNFRRFTYFVSREFTNKTFLKRIGEGDFATLEKIKEAFAIGPVTDLFYREFFVEYGKLVGTVKKVNKITEEKARDFVLLFAIRTIFLGFIQKRKWLGDNEKFIQHFFAAYQKTGQKDKFYEDWLSILFFEALNHKFTPRKHLPAPFNDALMLAPYLNGGLFKEKKEFDEQGWRIPDKEISDFFDFLFSHSFTIEESSLTDAELQLNPEFLGIIFERLVNKADGAVYTPRTEVDLMCRLSLVQWLVKNLDLPITKTNLYELFFLEGEAEEDQKHGSFSEREAREILAKLESLSICDPAVGSGAFLVGMMQVLDEVEEHLRPIARLSSVNVFERKKQIIAQSLYGVEVKEWAVWICQLRLWLSLFVDAPDDMRHSPTAILPSLEFKVRQGDSLVQRIGNKTFPVSGHASVGKGVKDKVTKLKNLKTEYFYNKANVDDWEIRQRELSIYGEILDAEMDEKRQKIKVYKQKRTETLSFDVIEEKKPKQSSMDFDKERIAELESQIEELKEQKASLRKDKPLVWNIEFAEIFVEKEGFDIIIGNPPYVRQEEIADPLNKIKDKKEYKARLQEMVRLDFPEEFPAKKKINAQSDLYTYFYIRALRLLNPQGIHTFICSNSWLDVGYGVWLQEFLLNRCPVEFIIDNHAKRSFEAADINTIISIIHAPRKKVDPLHSVKFVVFKRPFEEAIYTENLLAIENSGNVISNKIFRVYPITVKELKDVGTEYENEEKKKLGAGKYEGDKWGGKYLRAPDIFFTILEKGKDTLVKLGEIADVRRGFTTGVNEFFYLDNETIEKWKIEPEYLKPVIKSPRECKSIIVDPKKLKYKLFVCNKSKKELKGTNALKYIEWGERQKTKDGAYWKDVPTVSNRRYWYILGERKPARINFNYLIDEIGVSYLGEVFVSDNFQEVHTEKDIDIFLNSFVFYLFQLNTGRVSFGGGLLKIQTYELNRLLVMEIKDKKIKYLRKNESSIFDECGIDPESKIPIEEQEPKPLPDRAELDKIVFDALGLTEEERKDVYRAVCRLVWNRISKARSV
ncbi:MAG TPA: Eco57I restriction-modification methylase domain-containing protein [Smithellaceae bacterium]|nr:Eco57I restriction-modification methylase domain-containing protein [Smithellaceae bacterium]HRS88480.1 Eco57I restriction-modification methylase domain-containing protein [Smithellaceae bacterium]HRV25536.1 Eco57I restriction-modification methylase domain-containing protein [Smithellaceae bacterium]